MEMVFFLCKKCPVDETDNLIQHRNWHPHHHLLLYRGVSYQRLSEVPVAEQITPLLICLSLR